MRKHILIVLGLILLVIAAGVTYVAWPDTAELSVDQVAGKLPKITDPRIQTIPTVKVAKVVGWQNGAMPTPAAITSRIRPRTMRMCLRIRGE